MLLGKAQTTGTLDFILGVEVHGGPVRLDRVEKLPACGLFLKVRMRLVERVLIFGRQAICDKHSSTTFTTALHLLDFSIPAIPLDQIRRHNFCQLFMRDTKPAFNNFHSSTFLFLLPCRYRSGVTPVRSRENRYICAVNYKHLAIYG